MVIPQSRARASTCARQTRTDIGFRDAEHVGNLAVAEALERQCDDLPVIQGQLLYRVEQPPTLLLGRERFFGIRSAVFHGIRVLGILDRSCRRVM